MIQFCRLFPFSLFICLIAIATSIFGDVAPKPKVLVTVPPYRYFVERVADGLMTVELMVPVGVSAHTYEPTFRQVLEAGKADLWFTIGEPFETRVWRALQPYHPKLKQVDLRRGLNLIAGEDDGNQTHCSCHPDGFDLHMWLSPLLVVKQVDTIVQALQERYPQYAASFAKNGSSLREELIALDGELRKLLVSPDGRKRLIVVSHPAFAYLGRDYGVKQLSVEMEGKDPTPRQLTGLLMQARRMGITVIYTQPQYSVKGATCVAHQLGAHLVTVDPYSEDYFTMMRNLANHFAEAPLEP